MPSDRENVVNSPTGRRGAWNASCYPNTAPSLSLPYRDEHSHAPKAKRTRTRIATTPSRDLVLGIGENVAQYGCPRVGHPETVSLA